MLELFRRKKSRLRSEKTSVRAALFLVTRVYRLRWLPPPVILWLWYVERKHLRSVLDLPICGPPPPKDELLN